MYLSAVAIVRAIRILKDSVHPFLGITFLACKRYGLAVGTTETVSVDGLTRAHLIQHHLIDRGSPRYFQPFRGSGAEKWWLTPKYASGGLQTVNTQTFPKVFLHSPNGKEWGFASDYVSQIVSGHTSRRRDPQVPADALAAWLYKSEDLGDIGDYERLVERFFSDYNITDVEQATVFSKRELRHELPASAAFTEEPLAMTDVVRAFPAPPDAAVDVGSTITSLRLANVGPSDAMAMDFGERLSVVTGDNGLGKSFLLDFAWWAATGAWADRETLPALAGQSGPEASVTFSLRGESGRLSDFTATFDVDALTWTRPPRAMTVEALAVFSRADGSFAISDPLTKRFARGARGSGSLSSFEVWNGRPGVIDGLIKDWVLWSQSADRLPFDRLKSVLRRLSPEDMGALTPGPAVRIPGDNRDIPTISHTYGNVPVTQASSGVQRVLLLAYLIIWSWQEHERGAALKSGVPLRRMLVVVDELEAHLHPKWQRIVLPALMTVGELLSSELAIQMIAATHSPMILASLEGSFDSQTDVLYHLFGDGQRVRLEETAFVKYGDASGWLTSPLFGLRHARHRDAERAIDDAKRLQASEDVSADAVREVSERLKQLLADDDKFWPRWLYFAEQHGVRL